MKKQCLVCKEGFTGRIDKKFCSDECRVEYNNNLNRDLNNYMRNVNNIIRKNRRILNDFNPNGKARVSRKSLLDKGFKFNYMTSIYTTKAGKVYHFCYEQGILDIGGGYYTLVVKQEYAE